MFFKKKKSGSVTLKLTEDLFCVELNETAKDVTKDYNIIADGECYNLLYRDGQFLGIPRFYGGAIYPFSQDPTREGSNGEKKKFNTAKVVCIPKDFNLKVLWGTKAPFNIVDEASGKNYKVRATGVFYVNINPTDAARDADRLYSKWMSHREERTTEALRDFLCDAFVPNIEQKIKEYIVSSGKPVDHFIGNHPDVKLEVSTAVFPKMKDMFGSIGLTIVKELSESSILGNLNVEQI